MRRVLLLKPGVASSRALLGDYEVWFRHAFGGLAEVTPVELHAGEALPSLAGFDAAVVTGSPLSLTSPEAWMRRAGDACLEAAARGTAVLGVCFGHQLLAFCLGAQVRRCPGGPELGTSPVHLTAEGQASALFAGLPEAPRFQQTHEDEVAEVPAGAQLLASSEACRVQAFAHGARLFGVQFHPEMDAASVRHVLRADGRLTPARRQALVDGAADTPEGAALLRNFLLRVG